MAQGKFTNDQLKRFANILDNAGQVVLAAVVIPSILGLIDTASAKTLLLMSTITTVICWWFALRIERISS